MPTTGTRRIHAVLFVVILSPVVTGAQGLVLPEQLDRAVAAAVLPAASGIGGWRGRDPIWNGLAIGAVSGGVLFGWAAHAVSDGHCSCTEPIAVGAAIGAGIGVGVDALLDRRRSSAAAPPPKRIRVAPAYTARRKAVVAHIHF